MGQVARVVLADAHPAFAEGLGAILETHDGVTVLGVAHDTPGAVRLVAEHRPAVLLLDAGLPGGELIMTPDAVRAASPATKVLLLATEATHRMLRVALVSGADGLLTKGVCGQQVVDAIRAAVTGERVGVGVMATAPSVLGRDASMGRLRLAALSGRERDVLALLARGWSTRRIAQEWRVADSTVRKHVQNLLAKLDVHGKLEAAAFAWEHGVVAADGSTAAWEAERGAVAGPVLPSYLEVPHREDPSPGPSLSPVREQGPAVQKGQAGTAGGRIRVMADPTTGQYR